VSILVPSAFHSCPCAYLPLPSPSFLLHWHTPNQHFQPPPWPICNTCAHWHDRSPTHTSSRNSPRVVTPLPTSTAAAWWASWDVKFRRVVRPMLQRSCGAHGSVQRAVPSGWMHTTCSIELNDLPGLAYVELAGKVKPRPWTGCVYATRSDSVNRGIDLPQSYTGRDVLIGVTDWGFDYTASHVLRYGHDHVPGACCLGPVPASRPGTCGLHVTAPS
jgi:hypothetical protein